MGWPFLISCLLFKTLLVKREGERRCKESVNHVIFSILWGWRAEIILGEAGKGDEISVQKMSILEKEKKIH